MTGSNCTNTATALVIALIAAAVPSPRVEPDPAAAQPAIGEQRGEVDLRPCRWFTERKVAGDSGDEIASVSDLIVDRGSGRAEYAVIRTGTTLGLGGKAVAIPYGAFRWDSKLERYVLSTSGEHLKQFPEFTSESWAALREAKGKGDSALHRRMAADPDGLDPYAGGTADAKKIQIDGEITDVDRERTTRFGEQVVLTVKTGEGASRRVALGPSWYVNGAAVVPMRGDRVRIEGFSLPRDPEGLAVAGRMKIGESEVRLRDGDGSPAWSLKSADTAGKSYGMAHWRYMLLSQLPGSAVDCRGQPCGRVDDIILDRPSGTIAFLSIDPNRNVLGIGDTKRLVPWSVATAAVDGTVRIDASKEMILASPETPKDPAMLGSGDRAAAVYEAYKVRPAKFEPPKSAAPAAVNPPGPWSARGPVLSTMDTASARTVRGKSLGTMEVKFETNPQPARAVRIKAGDQEEVVLLGPAWYLDNQKLEADAGTELGADVVRVMIDHKAYWLARSIEVAGRRVPLVDGDRPAWDRR